MFDTDAVIGTHDEIAKKVRARHGGLATHLEFTMTIAAARRGGRAVRDPRRAEATLAYSVVIVAVGAEPLLLLPDSLLLLPLMKFPPAAPSTAVLLANRESLVSA